MKFYVHTNVNPHSIKVSTKRIEESFLLLFTDSNYSGKFHSDTSRKQMERVHFILRIFRSERLEKKNNFYVKLLINIYLQ